MSDWREFLEPELHDESELGPCEACEGCEYCVPCGCDRMSCICTPKIQDLEPDDDGDRQRLLREDAFRRGRHKGEAA